MSAAVATEQHDHATVATPVEPAKLTFAHLLRSEWIKFWTVRSTFWTLGVFLVVMVALTPLITLAFDNAPPVSEGGPTAAELDPLNTYQVGIWLGQFAVAILGALTITGEYTTGMIRTSLTAAPKRLPVLWSKAVVAGVSMFAFALIAVAASAGLQWVFFHDSGLSVDLGDSQQVRALAGMALYIATIGMLAFAFGALMRHSAAAVSTVLGLVLLVPIILQVIPWNPTKELAYFLPGSTFGLPSAGPLITMTDQQIAQVQAGQTIGVQLTAWEGYGVLAAWVVVVLAIAAVLLKKRDA